MVEIVKNILKQHLIEKRIIVGLANIQAFITKRHKIERGACRGGGSNPKIVRGLGAGIAPCFLCDRAILPRCILAGFVE